jgi:hypothetical protein
MPDRSVSLALKGSRQQGMGTRGFPCREIYPCQLNSFVRIGSGAEPNAVTSRLHDAAVMVGYGGVRKFSADGLQGQVIPTSLNPLAIPSSG